MYHQIVESRFLLQSLDQLAQIAHVDPVFMHRLDQRGTVNGRHRQMGTVAHEMGQLVDEQELCRFRNQLTLGLEFLIKNRLIKKL